MAEEDWHKQETYKSMIDYGRGMLRFVFLVNGGAIIGIMTFMGNVYSKSGTILPMKTPIIVFLVGIFFAGLATATAYMAQFKLFNESVWSIKGVGWGAHMRWVFLTMTFLLISLIAFATGSLLAVSAF
jgi:hypothetical protein